MGNRADSYRDAYGGLGQDVKELIDAGVYPETQLGEYAALAHVVQRDLASEVAFVRKAAPRKSWAAIGAELGVTAQAAQQRFGKKSK